MSNLKTPEQVRDSFSFIEKLNGKEIVEIENLIEERDQAHCGELVRLILDKRWSEEEKLMDGFPLMFIQGRNSGIDLAITIVKEVYQGNGIGMETLKHRGGCGCCPKSEDILAMDTELYYSFGGYAVRKDGNHYFREELDKEWGTNKTLSQIEEEAKLFPDSVWHIDLDLPLRGATWTRKEDGQWHLTETNQGFA